MTRFCTELCEFAHCGKCVSVTICGCSHSVFRCGYVSAFLFQIIDVLVCCRFVSDSMLIGCIFYMCVLSIWIRCIDFSWFSSLNKTNSYWIIFSYENLKLTRLNSNYQRKLNSLPKPIHIPNKSHPNLHSRHVFHNTRNTLRPCTT